MELSFSKQAKLETLDNFKYPKAECCKQNFIKGYFYDVKFGDFTDIAVQPDIIKSTKITKKLLADFDIDSYVVTKENAESARSVRQVCKGIFCGRFYEERHCQRPKQRISA